MTSAAPEQPLVSVVIPVYGDDDGLRATLRGLADQTYPAEKLEIVVVDNGPQPSLEWLADELPEARLVHEPRPGSYAARNAGVAASTGDVLAFTDADCRPEPQWVQAAVNALEGGDEPVSAVAGRIVVIVESDRPTAVEHYERLLSFDQAGYVERVGFGATANLIVRRDAFEAVGPFDARLLSGGDYEWGRRLTGSGRTLSYCEDARVGHPARSTVSQMFRKRRRVIGGYWVMWSELGLHAADTFRWTSIARAFLPPVRRLPKLLREGAGLGLVTVMKMTALLFVLRYQVAFLRLAYRLGLYRAVHRQ